MDISCRTYESFCFTAAEDEDDEGWEGEKVEFLRFFDLFEGPTFPAEIRGWKGGNKMVKAYNGKMSSGSFVLLNSDMK